MSELTEERYKQLLEVLKSSDWFGEEEDSLLLEMDLETAGIKLEGQEEIQKAMQIIMNLLIKQPTMNNRYYLQTSSYVMFDVKGKQMTYPLFMASGVYDRKKLIGNNVCMVRKGMGVKHLLAHIYNIRKLKDKNFRDGLDSQYKPVTTTKVAFDCYEKALQEVEKKLRTVLKPDGKTVLFEYDNKHRVSNIVLNLPVTYGGEMLMFKFVIDIPTQGTNEISTIKSGYPKRDLFKDLKAK